MQQSQWGKIRLVQWVEQMCQRLWDQCFQQIKVPAQRDDEAEEQIEDGKDKRRA